ncbi:hypothetical protein [Sphaerisporangium rhizosphaerae]|uniref:Ig-like domain-containing protein n=1 Tax=Sphaerisporangium rhizosphaerae TaxID=2269375 RepID=A0ABW2P7E5_9ACTN
MIAGNPVRRVLALGSTLVAIGALSVVASPPAAADGIVLQATVDCLNNDYYGDTRDWYPTITALPYSSMTAIPATHAWQYTVTLPAGSTSAASVPAMCSSGHQYGDYAGSVGSVSIPAGTTTVTATWGCYAAPVYPGPWLTTCSPQSVTYS